jgi:hypothetical protein
MSRSLTHLGQRSTTIRIASVVAAAIAFNPLPIAKAHAEVIGGRPAGCPHRYCGCAAAQYINLPNSDGRWNLARKWLAFPRAAPGPGMAVVHGGHVAIIIGGGPGAWQLYDPNSGGGKTRVHTRPLFGTVVSPHGHQAMAQAEPVRSKRMRVSQRMPETRLAYAPPE